MTDHSASTKPASSQPASTQPSAANSPAGPDAAEFTQQAAQTQAAETLRAIRDQGPLVHNITNSVTPGFIANSLLAVGAAPAMIDIAEEAGLFAGVASGLLINLGTISHQQRDAAREAVPAANRAGTPWVLDPVAIGALPFRTDLAAELLQSGPTAVRGNASEIIALAGAGAGGRGVDSADETTTATPAASTLARDNRMIVAVSGAEDLITDGHVAVHVGNGHRLLTQVTGAGCALGAIVAAALGSRDEIPALHAVAGAHVVFGLAAEQAAERAAGPGSFAVGFLDALATVSPDEVSARARIQVGAAARPPEPDGAPAGQSAPRPE